MKVTPEELYVSRSNAADLYQQEIQTNKYLGSKSLSFPINVKNIESIVESYDYITDLLCSNKRTIERRLISQDLLDQFMNSEINEI